MKKIALFLLLTGFINFAQHSRTVPVQNTGQKNKVVHPAVIKHPVSFNVINSLRNQPIVTDFTDKDEEMKLNNYEDREINPNIHPPKNFNAIYQGQFSSTNSHIPLVAPQILYNFDGQDSGYYPPDTNGAVNENYYFQVVNTTYAIYDKNGNILAGPSNLNTVFDPGLPGTNCNDGDPIVLWDEHANKWFYSEFSICGNNDYMLIAVSQTDDPTGAWWSWSFDVDDTPDYMKFGIWRDGYYMATNTGSGKDVYVFERDKMIVGDPNPTLIGFDNPNRPQTFDGFHCIMPFDNDGDWAPAGTPGQFITIADDGQGNPADELWLYELDADWNTPANSTFQRTQTIQVAAFSGNFNSSWENIPQPGTNQKLDGLSTILMFRAVYRNFNGDQRLVITHTIAEQTDEAAIRWYELQKSGNNNWAIRQWNNINPDNISRWNASIAINAQKEIGIAYSVSNANVFPGIRFQGQTTVENANATNTLNIDETVIVNGQHSQTNAERWGDYCNISVDPTDNRTFWFTSEYKKANTHGTKIAAFKFPDDCIYPNNQASNVQAVAQGQTQIDLSWTRGDGDMVIVLAKENSAVDSNPLNNTTYNADSNFGNGDEIGNGNFVVYNGTGTSVSITGLNSGTNYHFAVYEYDTTYNCYLVPAVTVNAYTDGIPAVETLPMLQINHIDAIAQGNVISENGATVTERGVCWSTSPDPTTADNHASNGTGAGTYSVNMTGLTDNTLYFVRAYAINSYGTAYGDNISFSTGCDKISGLPYLENFNAWTESNPQMQCTADSTVNLEYCWENNSGDDSDWDILSGATASSNTGPSNDVTGGGKYVYLEASSCYNKTASILTPHFDFSNIIHPFMKFHTHMYGSDMGDLNVYYSTDNGQNWTLVKTISGDQGNQWIENKVDLNTLTGEADVQFKFTATTGNGYRSDIAIDNFIVDYTPLNYCIASGNMDYNTAITNVVFNQISNNSGGKINAYEDYTDMSTVVKQGSSYDLSIAVDTDGGFTIYSKVWIDWNQDGDFTDAGEEYDMGTAYNVSNGNTSNSPLAVVIPSNALIGKTRMRVSARYNQYAGPCESGYDGEVEDYSVIVSSPNCPDIAYWNGSKWIDKDYIELQTNNLSNKLIIVRDNLISGGNNLNACGLDVETNKIVKINSGDYINLTHDVINEGKIDIDDDGILVQSNNNATIEGNGEYKLTRNTQNMLHYYDYAYWSIPIESYTLGEVVNNAWRYYSFDAQSQSWVFHNGTDNMTAGVGYAISAPNGFTGGNLQAIFVKNGQKFNNGDIDVPIYITGTGAQDDDDWNLVGNPYPSPVDFDQLASDNANIQGAYYLWTNCAGLDNNGNHQQSGYTVYSTGSGSTSACSGSGPTATQYIPVAEGFFVEANAPGNLTFKNSQRSTTFTGFVNRMNSDRVWLDFTDNLNFQQTLIGFFDNATDQKDRLFDAPTMGTGFDLYSINENNKFTIQGLSAWNNTDRVIPLGYSTTETGTHQIAINRTEGILNYVNIYLQDNYLNILHDLKTEPYTFQTDRGQFDNRFKLIFTRNNMAVDEIEAVKKINLLSGNGKYIVISNQADIKTVDVYGINGKLLKTIDSKTPVKTVHLDLSDISHQVLIFKIKLKDGTPVILKGIR